MEINYIYVLVKVKITSQCMEKIFRKKSKSTVRSKFEQASLVRPLHLEEAYRSAKGAVAGYKNCSRIKGAKLQEEISIHRLKTQKDTAKLKKDVKKYFYGNKLVQEWNK